MNARPWRLAVLSTAMMVLAAIIGLSGQQVQPAAESIKPQVIEVPFPFVAGTSQKTWPAGTYDLELRKPELLVLRARSGAVVEVQVMTRLARPSTPLRESVVVFDRAGDRYFISEVWVPDADGFLVGAVRDSHTHATVKATKKK